MNDTVLLLTPDYEIHYQELASKLREQAEQQPTDMWSVVCGSAAKPDLDRLCTLMGEIALLWVQLVFLDLGSLGISVDSARLIVLTRLVVDEVPLGPAFKQELMAAIVNTVEAASIAARTEISGEK
jgi:hypothetical protein